MGLFDPERGQMFVERMGIFCLFWQRRGLKEPASPAKTRLSKALSTLRFTEITLFDVIDRPPLKRQVRGGAMNYELKITNVVNGEWLIEHPQP